MNHHELKTWPKPFQAMIDGDKTFEFRKNDRDYQAGDWLTLKEWDPAIEKYTGRTMRRFVTYILHGGKFGLPQEFCIMAVVPDKYER